MKALEKSDKTAIKLRFAAALSKQLDKSGIKSWKKLAEAAGMEPSHIQKISVGKVDVVLTTSIAIANAFKMSYTELSAVYDQVSEEDVQVYIEQLEAQKNLKGKAKLPLPTHKKKKLKRKNDK